MTTQPPGSIDDLVRDITAAWQRVKPQPVYVFCPPADCERVTGWVAAFPDVNVIAHTLVPAGTLWVAKDLPYDPTNREGD